jgi:hypothetical protein
MTMRGVDRERGFIINALRIAASQEDLVAT